MRRLLGALGKARGGWPRYLTEMLAGTPPDMVSEHGLFYRRVPCPSMPADHPTATSLNKAGTARK